MNNNGEKEKISKIKLFIIIFDIIAVIGLVISFQMWNNKRIMKDNNVKDFNTYYFRKFTYNIPNDIEYTIIDDKRLKLKADTYEVVVEAIIDRNKNMFNKRDVYYQILKENNINVDKPIYTKIGNTPVVLYKKYDKRNSIICYFNTNRPPFAYEIELFNNDNSFNTDRLESIINILLNADYDEESTEKYLYYSANFA